MGRSEVNPFCASHKAPCIPMSKARGFTARLGKRSGRRLFILTVAPADARGFAGAAGLAWGAVAGYSALHFFSTKESIS